MDALRKLFSDYGWGILVFVLFSVGGRIYFMFQPLGLTFVLSGVMLLLALENSDMIHAVEIKRIDKLRYQTMLVHLHGQHAIAYFIYLYNLIVYGFLVLFSIIILLLGSNMTDLMSTIINILIIIFFLSAAITIFIRRILVGAKYEH